MKMLTARVIEGRLDLPSDALREGETVTVLIPEENEQGFHLSQQDQKELQAAVAEVERGEVVDGWELLDGLRS